MAAFRALSSRTLFPRSCKPEVKDPARRGGKGSDSPSRGIPDYHTHKFGTHPRKIQTASFFSTSIAVFAYNQEMGVAAAL